MKKSILTSVFTLSMSTFLASSFILSPTSFADRKWNKYNDPMKLDSSYTLNFHQMPLWGEANQPGRGWADSYWPKVNGLIADRWQVKSSFYKEDYSPRLEQLRSMSLQEISLLSPAEKFDIARGQYHYPVVSGLRKELKKTEKDWRGLCNGWAVSSLNVDEPQPVVMTNSQGIQVPFGSSDIKGLLAYYYSFANARAQYVGSICKNRKKLLNFTGACNGVHPAAFHTVLANEIGIRHQGFTADQDRGAEVWNQPFVSYSMKIDQVKTRGLSNKASKEAKKEVYITATVGFVNELYTTDDENEENSTTVAPSYAPVLGTAKNKIRNVEYQYVLELDRYDRVIGGEWISYNRPDLIWKQEFTRPGSIELHDNTMDNWSYLSELIRASTGQVL